MNLMHVTILTVELNLISAGTIQFICNILYPAAWNKRTLLSVLILSTWKHTRLFCGKAYESNFYIQVNYPQIYL